MCTQSVAFPPLRCLIAFELQSLYSERRLTDICKVKLESKCSQGQSFCTLYKICKVSFCDLIVTANNHNVALTISFWIRDKFIKFKNSCCFPIFIFYYTGTAGPKIRQCITWMVWYPQSLPISRMMLIYVLTTWVSTPKRSLNYWCPFPKILQKYL